MISETDPEKEHQKDHKGQENHQHRHPEEHGRQVKPHRSSAHVFRKAFVLPTKRS